MKETVNTEKKTGTLKKTVLVNILVNLVFAVVFSVVYQIVIFKNINVFGQVNIDGWLLPKGFSVQKVFVITAIVNIVLATVFWLIQKLRVKLVPLLLIAVLVPLISYNVNHSIFIDGSGQVYKEKQTIVMGLKDAEKEYKKTGKTDHEKTLKEHPIFLAEYDNGKFKTYLHINEDLDRIYVFSKLDDDSKTCYNDAVINAYHYSNGRPENEKSRTISINKNGIKSIEIFEDCLYVIKADGNTRMFTYLNYGWLMDEDGRPNA